MAISTLSSNSASIYTVIDTTTQADPGTTANSDNSPDDAGLDETPALAGSSNALQSLFALTQPDGGVTAALVADVVNATLAAPTDAGTSDTTPSTFGIDPSSLASVSQPDTAFTGSPANATDTAPGTLPAASTSVSASGADTSSASAALASAGSTTTTNSDGSTTTTTINADGSVSVETSPAASDTGTTSSASNNPSQTPSVDDDYLAYLTVPTIPVDNSMDYSDGG